MVQPNNNKGFYIQIWDKVSVTEWSGRERAHWKTLHSQQNFGA